MRLMALALLLIVAVGVCLSQPAATPWVVPGLELTAPQTRTRPGLVKVTAKVTAKDEKSAKTAKVVFDVEYVFADDDAEAEWEVREDGRTVQIVVPDSRGVINVTAVAVIDGEPTKFAKTSVEVDYKPREPKAPLRKSDEKKEEKKAARPKVTDVYVILSHEDDPDVVARFGGVAFKNKLARVGVVGAVVSSERIDEKKLRQYVTDAGGSPCVLYLVGDDKELKVRGSRKLKKTDSHEDVIKEATAE